MSYDINIVVSSLRNYDLFERVRNDIKSEWLTEKTRNIYNAICLCHEQKEGRTICWKDIRVSLRGRTGYEHIANVVRKSKGASEVLQHKQLGRFIYENLLRDLVNELAEAEESGGEINYDLYISKLEAAHKAASLKTSTTDFLDKELTDWIVPEEKVSHLPLPIKELNIHMGGGLPYNHISTLLARTDGGKTSFCVCVGAEALKVGRNIVHCTQETPEKDLGPRYYSSIMNHTWPWIQKNPESFRKAMKEIRKKGGSLTIADFTSVEATTADVRTAIEGAYRRYGSVDLVIIDAGDDIRSTRRSDKKSEEVANTWTELRRLCRKFECAMIISTQANRLGAAAEEVDLIHISEGWGKATKSSEVIVIDVPKNREKGLLILSKTKQKGVYPRVPIRFNRERCTFKGL